jgi:hypothetical protein
MLKKLKDVIILTSKNYDIIILRIVLGIATELFTGKMSIYSRSPVCTRCYGIIRYTLPLTNP